MTTKRDAVGVVDAINSEDIGKFPDSNLSESLQRITGISISRRDGEGSQITARGFGAAIQHGHAERPHDAGGGRVLPARRAALQAARSTSRTSPRKP